MSSALEWDAQSERTQSHLARTDARSWSDLRLSLVGAWVRFAEILGTKAPPDVRGEIRLNFFASSGRVVFGHGRREQSVADGRWESVPTEYVWTVTCKCPWVEELWYSASGEGELAELGVALARVCLESASAPEVVDAFRQQAQAGAIVRGQGVTQSPAPFEAALQTLLDGRVPALRP